MVPPAQNLPEIKFGVEAYSIALDQPDPDALPSDFVSESAIKIAQAAAELMPGLDLSEATSDLCYYTETEGSRLLVQSVPENNRITLVSSCSGHGFKYAPAMAEKILTHALRSLPMNH
jgi:glycine/D-amino acid oxidase-like deaminating enzyme